MGAGEMASVHREGLAVEGGDDQRATTHSTVPLESFINAF